MRRWNQRLKCQKVRAPHPALWDAKYRQSGPRRIATNRDINAPTEPTSRVDSGANIDLADVVLVGWWSKYRDREVYSRPEAYFKELRWIWVWTGCTWDRREPYILSIAIPSLTTLMHSFKSLSWRGVPRPRSQAFESHQVPVYLRLTRYSA